MRERELIKAFVELIQDLRPLTWAAYGHLEEASEWEKRALRLLNDAHDYLKSTEKECPHGDPYCPCQDGDPCNHEG